MNDVFAIKSGALFVWSLAGAACLALRPLPFLALIRWSPESAGGGYLQLSKPSGH